MLEVAAGLIQLDPFHADWVSKMSNLEASAPCADVEPPARHRAKENPPPISGPDISPPDGEDLQTAAWGHAAYKP